MFTHDSQETSGNLSQPFHGKMWIKDSFLYYRAKTPMESEGDSNERISGVTALELPSYVKLKDGHNKSNQVLISPYLFSDSSKL